MIPDRVWHFIFIEAYLKLNKSFGAPELRSVGVRRG